jgi:2-C-methyl-D-erythritol 4-phosphate cytidylyltransferase/2-C-methyl-D-erythritol 2,4-cyclodiphosphate synthase
MRQTAVIVVAAGSGTRLGAGIPKAFASLDGRTILHHALRAVFAADPAEVVLVVPASAEPEAQAELEEFASIPNTKAMVAIGGKTRQESVAAGLARVSQSIRTVLVHDAARPYAPTELFRSVAGAVADGTGVIPVLPVVDSLKRVADDEVVESVDRAALVIAQTPQGFLRNELAAAFLDAIASGTQHTDDASLFAAAGHSIRQVPGYEQAFKITTSTDLARARRMLNPTPRVGIGTDAHAFGGDGPLWLAGLEWPGEPGLSGHSDGDVVAHAIVDALLAAAGLGDIGEQFGTSDPELDGAHGDVFLSRTLELIEQAGFAISNVSVQFQGERPRFAARRHEAQAVLSAALGGAPVSVSATTTDGLGHTGRGEGIAATAIALLVAKS